MWAWRHVAAFAAPASVGPLVVAWSQHVLYGGPLTPGYVEWESFFRLAHVSPNLELYPRLLVTVHTPIVFLGLLAPIVLPSRVAWSALALLALNVAVYLPYLPLDDWPFLRFLLPGLTALFVMFSGVLVRAAVAIRARVPALAVLPLIPAVFVVWQGGAQRHYALNDWFSQARVRMMGHYLREALPRDAAVLSFTHSGAVRYYTGAQVVRLDLLEPGLLDRVVDDLRRRAYRPVFVLDESLEAAPFRALFAGSRYGRLDWPPRAVFTTVTTIWYFEADDLDRYARGERWVTDVLRSTR